jgi:hypothetical protein
VQTISVKTIHTSDPQKAIVRKFYRGFITGNPSRVCVLALLLILSCVCPALAEGQAELSPSDSVEVAQGTLSDYGQRELYAPQAELREHTEKLPPLDDLLKELPESRPFGQNELAELPSFEDLMRESLHNYGQKEQFESQAELREHINALPSLGDLLKELPESQPLWQNELAGLPSFEDLMRGTLPFPGQKMWKKRPKSILSFVAAKEPTEAPQPPKKGKVETAGNESALPAPVAKKTLPATPPLEQETPAAQPVEPEQPAEYNEYNESAAAKIAFSYQIVNSYNGVSVTGNKNLSIHESQNVLRNDFEIRGNGKVFKTTDFNSVFQFTRSNDKDEKTWTLKALNLNLKDDTYEFTIGDISPTFTQYTLGGQRIQGLKLDFKDSDRRTTTLVYGDKIGVMSGEKLTVAAARSTLDFGDGALTAGGNALFIQSRNLRTMSAHDRTMLVSFDLTGNFSKSFNLNSELARSQSISHKIGDSMQLNGRYKKKDHYLWFSYENVQPQFVSQTGFASSGLEQSDFRYQSKIDKRTTGTIGYKYRNFDTGSVTKEYPLSLTFQPTFKNTNVNMKATFGLKLKNREFTNGSTDTQSKELNLSGSLGDTRFNTELNLISEDSTGISGPSSEDENRWLIRVDTPISVRSQLTLYYFSDQQDFSDAATMFDKTYSFTFKHDLGTWTSLKFSFESKDREFELNDHKTFGIGLDRVFERNNLDITLDYKKVKYKEYAEGFLNLNIGYVM